MSIIVKNMEQAIKQYNDYEFIAALNFATLAVEATAEKYYNKKVTRDLYKGFIRDYYWILEPFMGLSVGDASRCYPNIQIYDEKKRRVGGAVGPDIADIIYNVFRCNIHHGQDIPIEFGLIPTSGEGGIFLHGKHKKNPPLMMPQTIVMGLLAICLFCKDNVDIKTDSTFYLSYDSSITIDANIKYIDFENVVCTLLIMRGDTTMFPFSINFGKEAEIKAFLAKQPRQPKVKEKEFYNPGGKINLKYEKEYV